MFANLNLKSNWKPGMMILLISAALLSIATHSALAANTSYYVDCSAASNGSGTQSSPWNNLATVSSTTFGGGDTIFFKRGTTCSGQLWPKGSGNATSPITIDSYGTGALPIINGGTGNNAAVRLYNQQGWHIQNVEITGGNTYGLWVGGNSGTLNHFRVTNVVVHDVIGTALSKNNGLVDIEADWGGSSTAVIGDVIVDGVTAYNTGQWNGIRIMCTGSETFPRNLPVTIRNSTVHDVGGDGIVIFTCNNGLIENTVAYNTGNITTDQYGTPNSTWTWSCKDCTVQYNEAYNAHSPSWDGGGFDVDYPDQNNIFQYNYGHDNDAYCISGFAGDSINTLNNTVRYNICSNNVRDGSYLGKRQGDLYITTWSQGTIQDTYVYNNTFFYNPATPPAGETYYAVKLFNIWHGKAINNTNIYNNIFYSTSPNLMDVENFASQTHMNNNLYWYTGAGNPNFNWGGTIYTNFSAFQSASGQEANGIYADPLLNSPTYHGVGFPSTQFTLQNGSPAINAGADLVALGKVSNMGSRDFFGNPIPQGGAYDIGVYESGGAPALTNTPTRTNTAAPPTSTPTAGPSPTPSNTPLPTNTPTRTPTSTATSTGCSGTTNIVLNRSTTTSSVQSGDVGAFAVDGNTNGNNSRWWALKGSTLSSEWIVVDLGSSMTFCKAIVMQDDRYATAYTIQVSPDNINWTTVFSTTSGNTGTATWILANATGRYVKWNSTAWFMNSDRVKLVEFQLYQP